MDLDILIWLQKFATPFFDTFFRYYTRLGDGGFVWIVLVGILLINKKTRKIGFYAGLSLFITGVFVNLVMKPLIMRPRPFVTYPTDILVPVPHGSSFPSGHASSSFAVAFYLYLMHVKYRRVYMVGALLIAISRMYLFLHYPSDVLVGSLVGIVIAWGVYWFYKNFDYKIFRKNSVSLR